MAAGADPQFGPWGFSEVMADIAANQVYAVTAIFDAISGTLTMFLDGVQVGEVTGIGTLYSHGAGVGIGGVNVDSYNHLGPVSTVSSQFFQGAIGDVIYWNQVIDQQQLRDLSLYMDAVFR